MDYMVHNFYGLDYFRKSAFTLAEVLITLGVIGIVAALTMPALISNHQKKETVVKLQKAQSQLAQAIQMSVSVNGDARNWDYIDDFRNVNIRKAFADKYIIPYVNGAKPSANAGYDHLGLGYSRDFPPRQMSGYVTGMTSPNYYPITYINGIFYYTGVNAGDVMSITVDLNGFRKPNIYGKDIFLFELLPEKNTVTLWGYQYDRGKLLELYCSKRELSMGCGSLIERDGWQILDDYPW